jgi:crotonobetainyl-CoA:carnitine CoA-transferase CaiB-like acyl-CoA transferase
LVDLLDLPGLRDERFATRSRRINNYDALMNLVRPWFAARTTRDVYALARQKGLPLGPVWTADDIRHDAQYLERDFLRLLPQGGFMPRIPLLWNGLRPGASAPGIPLSTERC